MKVLVTGNAGSGKSTLGKIIATKLGLPFYSLDKIVWQPGWKKTPAAERQKRLTQITAGHHWVIDGVSHDVQDAADVVIFLDMPRKICFWRVSKRNIRHLFSSRPDLPPNCPEILIIPALIKIIWRFPKRVRPTILHKSQDSPAFFHITSNVALAHFLQEDMPRLRASQKRSKNKQDLSYS